MNPDQETMFRTYAWSYFSFHADQRMKTFNFFLVVAGLLAGGGVSLIREGGSPWLVTPFGIALSALCVLFWKFDERNRTLIANGEAALKHLDSIHHPTQTGQAPHDLCIFERDEFNRQGRSRSIFSAEGYFSYSQIIRRVYGLFALLGVVLAIGPFFVNKSAVSPLAVRLETVPALSITSHQASASSVVPQPTVSSLPMKTATPGQPVNP